MASTGRYGTAQTGAPKLRMQPPATGITSCRVAFTPATFHAVDELGDLERHGYPRDSRDRSACPRGQLDVTVYLRPENRGSP